MADVYNDMRGLKGVLNFTDENAKMTKEVAIMVASFAVTAGVGPLLGALGVGARLAQSSNMARVAKLTQEGKRLRAGMATAKATAWRGTAATLEVGAKATNLATGTKIMPAGGRIRATAEVAHNALKFTTADALIRHFARAEGEKDGFDNFLSKLVTNTVMFGAFGGMEKLVTVKMLPK